MFYTAVNHKLLDLKRKFIYFNIMFIKSIVKTFKSYIRQ